MGIPLRIYQVTYAKDLNMYARVLVEVDFSRDVKYELIVERTGICNKIEVAYDLPKYCSFCRLLDTRFLNVRKLVDRLRVLFTPHPSSPTLALLIAARIILVAVR